MIQMCYRFFVTMETEVAYFSLYTFVGFKTFALSNCFKTNSVTKYTNISPKIHIGRHIL